MCELDLIFNFHKAYYILDELIMAGELQETNKKAVLRSVAAQVMWGLWACGLLSRGVMVMWYYGHLFYES